MKNKNTSLKIIMLAIFIFSAYAPHAFALKQAVFPDKKSLQPLPPDVYPNVSGNVNSSTTLSPEYKESMLEQQIAEEQAQAKTEENVEKKGMSFMGWLLLALAGISGVVLYKKWRESKKVS